MNFSVEIKTTNFKPHLPVKALASVTLDDAFVIHGVYLIQKDDKMFASMPSSKKKDNGWYNLCHPTNNETREALNAACVAAYNNYITVRNLR